jgi:acetylornithine/N-succinyldiaminopimelate aminotransferase
MPTYARADIAFTHGSGAYLYTSDGRRYLDFVSGVASTALGHAHPRLVKALTDQANRVWLTSNLFRVDGQEHVAQILVNNSFAESVFFCNSGTEAWECGLKLVRRFHTAAGQPERNRIITFSNGFHGRTMAAISSTRQEKLIQGFAPLLEGFDVIPFANLNELRAAITPQTAAICVEPIQGEAGVRALSWEMLRDLRTIADEFGLLLFFDEIQTGIGRTGKLFAHQWAGITPDIMCLAKGLGGGFPVGACLASARVAAPMTAGSHGSTFGGNPLAMAVAGAVLETILAPGFLDQVTISGERLRSGMCDVAARHPGVFPEVRGVGLLLGLRCGPPNTDLVTRLREQGLLVAQAADNVIRLLPPLIVGDTEIREALSLLETVAASFAV